MSFEASEGPSRTVVAGSWASSPSARRVMQGNRKRDTRPELAIRSRVHAFGLRYRVACRPLPGVGTADLVFHTPRVAVFVDGCYWHGCPEHFSLPRVHSEYWRAKIEGNHARDGRTDSALFDAGWISLRVWEHEDPAAAANRVVEVVLDRKHVQ